MRRRDLLALAGLAAQGCKRGGAPAALREISISMSEHLSVSSMHLADEAGYMRAAGFRMKPVRLSALQAIPLLAGGRVDVVLGSVPAAMINAVLRGMQIRVVAGREYVSPTCGDGYTLYSRKAVFQGGPADPRRLKGKRFSIRSRGITEFILDAFLAKFGMKQDDVQRIDLPLRESIAALAGGQIDAMFDTELSRSPLSVSPEIVRVWRYADIQPYHQYSFIAFGATMLNAGLEPGARFLAAYLKAAGDFLDGKTPRFMRDFAATHGLEVEKTVAECRDTFSRDGTIDAASVQRIIDWQVSRGYASAPIKAEQLIDGRYLPEARRLLTSGQWRVRPEGSAG